jgi:hypothetical protein
MFYYYLAICKTARARFSGQTVWTFISQSNIESPRVHWENNLELLVRKGSSARAKG